MISTLALCWYAMGWFNAGFFAMRFRMLTVGDLLVFMLGGLVGAVLVFSAFFADLTEKYGCETVLWRRK